MIVAHDPEPFKGAFKHFFDKVVTVVGDIDANAVT
jgi:hypothetical protein